MAYGVPKQSKTTPTSPWLCGSAVSSGLIQVFLVPLDLFSFTNGYPKVAAW